MSEATIPTMQMTSDYRLRRLFALVGSALHEDDISPHADALESLLLDIAPEFLPPDGTDDPALWGGWRDLVNEHT